MATGTIEFTASISGVRFESIQVSNPHPSVEKIVLEAKDDQQLRIVFYVTDIFNPEEARAIADEIVPSIVDRLAFHRDVPISDPRFTGSQILKDASASSSVVVTDTIFLWDHAVPVLTLGDDTRQELAMLLAQPNTHQHLYSAYRFAGNQDDAVARFMFLYSILLQLNQDKQQQVDDFIRSEVPGVSQSPRPDRPRVIETIYTRLRNEVGHVRAGAVPSETRGAIQDNIVEFQEVVRKAITQAVTRNIHPPGCR